MAEKVEQRLEQFLPTFEQLKKIGIYNEPEIKEIIRKRRSFEYSLQSKSVTLDTYLKYIQFESAVLELTEQRKAEKGIDSGERLLSDIDWPKHIHSIYRRAIAHFGQADLEIWNLYFDFCIANHAFKDLSQAFADCVRFHSGNPDLWIRYAKCEMEDNQNSEHAQKLMEQAIKEKPDEPRLYSTYAETIFNTIEKIKGRREIHDIHIESDELQAPIFIYKKALDALKNNSSKLIELYQLFKALFEKYSHETTQLTELAIKTQDPELLNYICLHESDTIEEKDAKFIEFLERFPDSRQLKIKYAIFLGNEKKDPQNLVKIIDEIDEFDDGETEVFVELLLNNNILQDAEDLLQDQLTTPGLQALKLRLMSAEITDTDEFINQAKVFLLKYNTFQMNSLFLILLAQRNPPLDKMKFLDIVKERASRLTSDDVAKMFKFSFLKYGADYAHLMMDSLMKLINPTPEFIDVAIQVEREIAKPSIPDPAKIRALHEINVSKWGDKNTDIWMNYCEFEHGQRNVKRLEDIRRRANKMLVDSSEFNRRYQEKFCKKIK